MTTLKLEQPSTLYYPIVKNPSIYSLPFTGALNNGHPLTSNWAWYYDFGNADINNLILPFTLDHPNIMTSTYAIGIDKETQTGYACGLIRTKYSSRSRNVRSYMLDANNESFRGILKPCDNESATLKYLRLPYPTGKIQHRGTPFGQKARKGFKGKPVYGLQTAQPKINDYLKTDEDLPPLKLLDHNPDSDIELITDPSTTTTIDSN